MALKIDAIDECNRSVGPLPTIPNYDWASHEIGEFLSCFHKMIGIAVVKWKTFLKSLERTLQFNLIVCKRNERVFHGKGSALRDFFFMYAYLLKDLLVQLPFNKYQIGVLREINLAHTQLHSNRWALTHAFKLLCSTLGLTPTHPIFLHYFCTCPNEKKGLVLSLLRRWGGYSPCMTYPLRDSKWSTSKWE